MNEKTRNVSGKHERAGRNGKFISCPQCLSDQKVHHFDWQGLECNVCKIIFSKDEWLVKEQNESKGSKRKT
jgi:hypothetical protein